MQTKFSIGGLIGVHVSSIVYWGCRGNFKSVFFFLFFFLRKDFWARKNTHKQTLANKTKNKWTKNHKGNDFLRAQTSKKVKVISFTFWCFLFAQSLFVKKKKKKKKKKEDFKLSWQPQYTILLLPFSFLLQCSFFCLGFIFVLRVWRFLAFLDSHLKLSPRKLVFVENL